jgi:hypothetical protein
MDVCLASKRGVRGALQLAALPEDEMLVVA